MFCISCGHALDDAANFCGSCGALVKRPAVPPVESAVPPPILTTPPEPVSPPVSPPPAPPPPVRTADTASTIHRSICPWCGTRVDGKQLSCPRCGATLTAPVEVSETGWKQLPGRKDMAKLQFGDSFCQIEGLYVPVADVSLAPSDSIYFTHHVLLWKDPQVNMTTMSLSGAWKRMFAGLPLVMMQAQGPGHIAFSRDAPGEMIALPLQPGETVDVREHLFMLATHSVAYDWFMTNIWYSTKSGDDTETHNPVGTFMDRFSAPQSPGLLILHAAGNVLVRELGHGEALLVKPTALIFKDPTVGMQLHFEHPRTGFSLWGSWGNRYVWLRLWGPGRVALQSSFERLEGENAYVTSCSPATEQQW